MRNIPSLLILAFFASVAFSSPAGAVCLDPKTWVSSYRIPLKSEIHSSQAIAIGKVVKTVPLHEDRDDPDGETAYLHTVRLLRHLKGNLPTVISVRVDNDSGRYAMSVGEEHLLFLTMAGSTFSIDSCGNSSQLPQGEDILKQVETQLGRKPMHLNNSFKPTLLRGLVSGFIPLGAS